MTRRLRGRSYLGAGMMVVLAYASGCSAFKAAAVKDPAAAVSKAEADAAKACTLVKDAEAAGLLTGKAAADVDAFCAVVDPAPVP